MIANPLGSMTPRIGILIPSLSNREGLLKRVYNELQKQVDECKGHFFVGIFINEDQGQKTTGTKRNELIQEALDFGVRQISFMDDDDMPGPTYVNRAIDVYESGLDCGELWGDIYWNGKKGKPFHHSIIHKEWWEDNQFYYRCPNHLNFIKLDLVKDVKFPDQNFGEDGQWSMKIKELGLLKTEYKIPETIYHYFNGNPKHAI